MHYGGACDNTTNATLQTLNINQYGTTVGNNSYQTLFPLTSKAATSKHHKNHMLNTTTLSAGESLQKAVLSADRLSTIGPSQVYDNDW